MARLMGASMVASGEHWFVDLSKAADSGAKGLKTMSCSVRGVREYDDG